jgi:pentatricopeptide repeat protein
MAKTKAEVKSCQVDKQDATKRSPAVSLQNVATPARGNRREREAATRGPASALEDLVRRRGVEEAWNALEDMQRQGLTTDKFTVSRMLMKTVGDSRSRLNPARVYRGIALVERFIDMQPKDVDEVLFNALLDTCCRLKDLPRLEATVQRMKDLKVKPSPVTLGILVKTYGQAGDLQKVLQVWSDMEYQRGQANAVTFGCMIDACVKCGNLAKAIEIFKDMREVGKHKNTILYTTLIKGYGLEKDLKNAMELFREMPREDVPYNTITYNSIIDACIKCGDLPQAEQLLREMTAADSSLEPDLITFSTLLKGYCHVGDIDKALRVAEAIKERGLRKDELVYNTLMDGCVKANDITAGVGLFEEMVQQHMRPSAITHSILVRLYQRAGYEDDAAEAVAQLYQHHGIERPTGGDRCKTFGKKVWGLKSPASHGKSSPCGSLVGPHGFGMSRDRAEGCWSAGSWDGASHVPMLPSFGESDQSGCQSPMNAGGGVFMSHCPMQNAVAGHNMSGSFVTATGHSADQMGFAIPGQYMASSPTNSCDMVAFTASCHSSGFPQWQYGCTVPAAFSGGLEMQAAYPCSGLVQPFAVMPVPVAPPYSVNCAPVGQHGPSYDGWGVDGSVGAMPSANMPCCS